MSKPSHNDIAQGIRDLIAEVNRLRWVNEHLLEALKASNDKMRSVLFDGDNHPLVAANNAAIAKAEDA